MAKAKTTTLTATTGDDSWTLSKGMKLSSLDGLDGTLPPVDALHRSAEDDPAAALLHELRGPLPHHARAVPRVVELVDEGLDDLVLALGPLAQQGVLDGGGEGQALDALSGPLGLNFRTGQPGRSGV